MTEADRWKRRYERERSARRQAESIAETKVKELHALNASLELALGSARRAERTRRRFLDGVSHELRTPLNAILGYGELMREQLEEGESVEEADLTHVLRSARHLLRLVDDVLTFTRVDEGEMVFDVRPTLPSDLAAGVVRRHRATTEGRAHDVDVSVLSDEPVRIDAVRVAQVMEHLLSNASKFGGDHTVRLEVASHGDALHVRIVDRGDGMSPGTEPFEQPLRLAEPGEAHRGGLGLGLALGRRLVSAMGGELCVSSCRGLGTVATFWVPDGHGVDTSATSDAVAMHGGTAG